MRTVLAKDWANLANRQMARNGGKRMSAEQRKAAMRSLLNKENGNKKVAEAMVGPISIRVNYEGISRQALVEDLVPMGEIRAYSVQNDIPKAYSLNSNDGEVRISQVEAKQVIPKYGRIATEWSIQRTDLELSAASPVEYADNQAVQSLMMKEDDLLYNGLDLLVDDWKDEHRGDGSNDITLASGGALDYDTVLTAQGFLESQRTEGSNIIGNPQDMQDIYRWDLGTVGLKFKDDVFAGYRKTTFGNWTMLRSVTVPKGTFYITAPANMLGIFSTRYGIEQTDDVTAANKFEIRSIFDELVSEVLVNRNAVVRIKKAIA